MLKKLLVLGMCLFLSMSLTACLKKDQKSEKQAFKMGTIIDILAYGPKSSEAIDAAFKRIDEIEQIANPSIMTSDVNEINQAAGKEYVKVHPEIIKMIKTSIEYSKISNGAFDITVGPLINLWKIGTDDERVPSDAEIKAKLPLVDYADISINESDNSVKLMKEGMSIDLGGIAKGFTADEILKVMKSYNIKSALINLGSSSIYALGQKPDGTLWSVGIRHPRKASNEDLSFIIKMPQMALSTSGDDEKFFIKDGKRYHHIINPSTGYPANAGVMSDTIVVDSNIPDCNMLADTLTKITFVSGVDKGMKIIDSLPGISCIAQTTDFKIYKSSAWNIPLDNLSPEFKMAN